MNLTDTTRNDNPAGYWNITPRQAPPVTVPLLRRPNQLRIFFALLLFGVEWVDYGEDKM